MKANKIEEEKDELAANSHASKDRRNKVLLWAYGLQKKVLPSLQIIHIKHNATALKFQTWLFFLPKQYFQQANNSFTDSLSLALLN